MSKPEQQIYYDGVGEMVGPVPACWGIGVWRRIGGVRFMRYVGMMMMRCKDLGGLRGS